MKILLIAIIILLTGISHAENFPAPKTQGSAPSFDFSGVAVGQAIQLIYAEALKQNYVIDPAVLADQRLVSFRYRSTGGDIRPFVIAFLRDLGVAVEIRDGIDYVAPIKEAEKPKPDQDSFVYVPKFRNSGYLSRLLGPMFEGRFTLNRAVAAPSSASVVTKDVPATSAAGAIDQDAQVMIFVGSPKEVVALRAILPQVDIPAGEVMVSAAVYEVTTNKSEGNAVQLALSLLGGRIAASLGSDVSPLTQTLSVRVGGFSGVISALDSDSRFNVITRPRLRVASGATGSLVVGQSVPILSSVAYQGTSGTPVQSVVYKDSGTILNITPTVRGEAIDLAIDQQISNFANTTTGLASTPTLTKRQMQTSISASDGEVIFLGGLTQEQSNQTRSRFPGILSIFGSKSSDSDQSEVLIVLQVSRVPGI